jgi:hypothetical protein
VDALDSKDPGLSTSRLGIRRALKRAVEDPTDPQLGQFVRIASDGVCGPVVSELPVDIGISEMVCG